MQLLNLLLVPVVGLQLKIAADLATLKAASESHERRITKLEEKPA